MSSRLRPLNVVDFTGGLNLRGDAFQLADNESPDMLNVEVDPRGGFFSREGWTIWNTNEFDSEGWDPRNAALHQLSNGSEYAFLANDDKVYVAASHEFSALEHSSGEVACSGDPHLVDFAPWGDDLYIACGRSEPFVRWRDGQPAQVLDAPATGSWDDDYTNPGGPKVPQAEFATPHAGYLFVANITENGTHFPNRFRWSHPNNPLAWAEFDFKEILEGGGKITGIVSFRDHLLIFKTKSVWALFGYDTDSWQVVNVSRSVGAPHRQVIAQSETAVYFFSPPSGIYAITAGGELQEMSTRLRPTFESAQFNMASVSNAWLGWMQQKLWFGAPWHPQTSADDAMTVFMMDPSLGERGSWTAHRAGDGYGLGPFFTGGFGGDTHKFLSCSRGSPAVLEICGCPLPRDMLEPDVWSDVDTYYTTRWFDAGWPTSRKSWRRPDLVMKERDDEYTVRMDVFHDYDESAPRRTGIFTVDTGSDRAVWGEFDWGDGTKWGPAPTGSQIERGRGLGPARSVRIRFTGEAGRSWGCDAIVLKYIHRRFR